MYTRTFAAEVTLKMALTVAKQKKSMSLHTRLCRHVKDKFMNRMTIY